MSPPPRSGLCLRGPCYQFDWDEAENQGGGEHSRQNHDFLHAEARHIHAGSVWHATDILGTLLRQKKWDLELLDRMTRGVCHTV